MSTGDIHNNLQRLQHTLNAIRYPSPLDVHGAKQGFPEAFLPLLHHAFLSYSRALAAHLVSIGHELYGKSDLRFIEAVYKILRDEFDYVPKVNKEQFFGSGFAERKILMADDVLRLCIAKHEELTRGSSKSQKQKLAAKSGVTTSTFSTAADPNNLTSQTSQPYATHAASSATASHARSQPAHPLQHPQNSKKQSVPHAGQYDPTHEQRVQVNNPLLPSHAEMGPRSDEPATNTVLHERLAPASVGRSTGYPASDASFSTTQPPNDARSAVSSSSAYSSSRSPMASPSRISKVVSDTLGDAYHRSPIAKARQTAQMTATVVTSGVAVERQETAARSARMNSQGRLGGSMCAHPDNVTTGSDDDNEEALQELRPRPPMQIDSHQQHRTNNLQAAASLIRHDGARDRAPIVSKVKFNLPTPEPSPARQHKMPGLNMHTLNHPQTSVDIHPARSSILDETPIETIFATCEPEDAEAFAFDAREDGHMDDHLESDASTWSKYDRAATLNQAEHLAWERRDQVRNKIQDLDFLEAVRKIGDLTSTVARLDQRMSKLDALSAKPTNQAAGQDRSQPQTGLHSREEDSDLRVPRNTTTSAVFPPPHLSTRYLGTGSASASSRESDSLDDNPWSAPSSNQRQPSQTRLPASEQPSQPTTTSANTRVACQPQGQSVQPMVSEIQSLLLQMRTELTSTLERLDRRVETVESKFQAFSETCNARLVLLENQLRLNSMTTR